MAAAAGWRRSEARCRQAQHRPASPLLERKLQQLLHLRTLLLHLRALLLHLRAQLLQLRALLLQGGGDGALEARRLLPCITNLFAQAHPQVVYFFAYLPGGPCSSHKRRNPEPQGLQKWNATTQKPVTGRIQGASTWGSPPTQQRGCRPSGRVEQGFGSGLQLEWFPASFDASHGKPAYRAIQELRLRLRLIEVGAFPVLGAGCHRLRGRERHRQGGLCGRRR